MLDSDAYVAATTSAAFFDLTNHAMVEVAGPDAAMFLHNLSTNDIKKVGVGSMCEAFFTTAKARVVAHVEIYHLAERFLLLLEPGRGESLRKFLDHYLISEQVELAERTGAIGVIRVVGPRAPEIAAKAVGANIHDLKQGGGCFARELSIWRLDDMNGVDLFGPPEQVIDLRARLASAGAIPGDSDTWETLRIEAGLPVFGKDVDEERLVMEVNRTAQAISYTKGCFLGQEPIVMARDRGQVNRLLVGVRAEIGAKIESKKLFTAQQEVGAITSATYSPRLDCGIGLAYVRRGFWEPNMPLKGEGDRNLTVCKVPFD